MADPSDCHDRLALGDAVLDTTHGAARRTQRATSGADKFMDDAQEAHNAYRKDGGTCGFDAFEELLRAFYEHTLNSRLGRVL